MKRCCEALWEVWELGQISGGTALPMGELAAAWNCSGVRMVELRGAESARGIGKAVSPLRGK